MNRSPHLSLTLLCLALMLGGCTSSVSTTPRGDPDTSITNYVQLGLSYLQNGQREQARANIQRALAIDSRSAEANHALALINQAEGELEAADEAYRRALASDREFTQARYNYARFLYGQQRIDAAREQFAVASEDLGYRLRPAVFVGLGICEARLGKPEEARQAFNAALRLDPGMAPARLELAELAYEQGDAAEAARQLDQFTTLASATARSLWLGVRIHRELGNADREASYGLALRNLFPDSREAALYTQQ